MSQQIDYKDWSGRLIRMRAELILFSTLVLFLGVIEPKITTINFFFIKFEKINDIKDINFKVFLFISIIWCYFFFSFLFRYIFEKGIRSITLYDTAKFTLDAISTELSSIKPILETNINEAEKGRIERIKEQKELISHQKSILKGTDDKQRHEAVLKREMGILVDIEKSNSYLGTFEEFTDHLEGIITNANKSISDWEKTINIIISERKTAVRAEKIDKVYTGVVIPLLYALFSLLTYISSSAGTVYLFFQTPLEIIQ